MGGTTLGGGGEQRGTCLTERLSLFQGWLSKALGTPSCHVHEPCTMALLPFRVVRATLTNAVCGAGGGYHSSLD